MLVGCHGRSQRATWLDPTKRYGRTKTKNGCFIFSQMLHFGEYCYLHKWVRFYGTSDSSPIRRIWARGVKDEKTLQRMAQRYIGRMFEEFMLLGISSVTQENLLRGWFLKMNNFHLKKNTKKNNPNKKSWTSFTWMQGLQLVQGLGKIPLRFQDVFFVQQLRFPVEKKILKVTGVDMGPSCDDPFFFKPAHVWVRCKNVGYF